MNQPRGALIHGSPTPRAAGQELRRGDYTRQGAGCLHGAYSLAGKRAEAAASREKAQAWAWFVCGRKVTAPSRLLHFIYIFSMILPFK